MRALLSLLALALLLVVVLAACGGGGEAPPSSVPIAAPALEPTLARGLALFEVAVAEDAAGGAVLSDALRIDGIETATRVAVDQPEGVYPSAHAPDGSWTARELLEWVAANGRPQAARAAQEALGSLP